MIRLKAIPDLRAWTAAALLVVVGTLIRYPQLRNSLAEAYAFRQTQTAFTVREYAEHGINLMQTPLPVFGPEASVPMEWPLFQAIASIFVTAGDLSPSVASRLLGLLSFQASAVLLFLLVRRWHGGVPAVTAVALMQLTPFGLQWGASSMIDFFSVALALAMVLCLDAVISGRSWWWLVGGVAAAVLCALVKVTTFPAWGLLLIASAVVAIRQDGLRRRWARVLLGLVAVPGAGLVAGVLWTRYADGVKGAREITEFVTSSALRQWNFAYPGQRQNPGMYLLIYQRIADEITGPVLFGAVLAVVASLVAGRFGDRVRVWGWIGVSLSAPLVFFNLYAVHSYYLIGVFPAMCAVTGVGLAWLWRRLTAGWLPWKAVVAWCGILAVFLIGLYRTPGGQIDRTNWLQNAPPPQVSVELAGMTGPDDLVVAIGCDWDPTYLYFADRRGVMFRQPDTQGFWDDHDVADYPVLLRCDPSLDPTPFLPPGTTQEPTDSPYFVRLGAAT